MVAIRRLFAGKAGKAALVLIVLNEVRGICVVVPIVWALLHR